MIVYYPGCAGAFSHLACLRFVPDREPVGLPGFADVAEAVGDGANQLGVLPLANNQAGETGASELILRSALRIVFAAALPIRMHLLGLQSSSLAEVRTVVSHPIALRQCSQSLALLGVDIEESSSTAAAAQSLAEPGRAVLASEEAGQLYGLKILKRNLHDRSDNKTTFAVIARGKA